MNPLGERATNLVSQLVAHFGGIPDLAPFREWRDLLNTAEADAHFGLLSQRIMAYTELSYTQRLVLQNEIEELERAPARWEGQTPICGECWEEIAGRPEYADAQGRHTEQAKRRREYQAKRETIARAKATSNPLSPRLRGGI